MKKVRKALIAVACVVSVLAGFFGVVAVYSHAELHRSLGATLCEWTLDIAITDFDSVENAERKMLRRSKREDDPYRLPVPSSLLKSDVRLDEDEAGQTLVLCGGTERTILYLHGGAYVNELSLFHLTFLDDLAAENEATVYVPLYPLAPNHTYEEAYAVVEKRYLELSEGDVGPVLMGDSAGGGFAAAFCEYAAEKGLPRCEKAVLISPWVDVSMSGNYDRPDPMLKKEGLVPMGKAWAGDTDVRDYRISPLFGDVRALPDTLLFAGTREIFYDDVRAFTQKLLDADVRATLVTGEGMNHVYPLYPIPESAAARKAIRDFLAGEEEERAS